MSIAPINALGRGTQIHPRRGFKEKGGQVPGYFRYPLVRELHNQLILEATHAETAAFEVEVADVDAAIVVFQA
jgi:hypothetical protein